MNTAALLIDGGTTNTRFTLMQGSRILDRITVPVGASNADCQHNNPLLRRAVSDTAVALAQKHGVGIAQCCISGMITSENGLYGVAHLTAPSGMSELAAAIRTVDLPDVLQLPIQCIPGIRTLSPDGVPDMMRGEETEIMGDISLHPGIRKRLYLHFGSHNKAIYAEDGRIVASRTTISGELYRAVLEHTILASSAGISAPEQLDEAFAKQGFEAARTKGLPGAIFGGRMLAVLSGASPCQVRSYLSGALVQQDALCFAPLLSCRPDELVLYGREQFVQTWQCCMGAQAENTRIRVIPYEESEWLSVHGILAILQQAGEVSTNE